MAEPAAWITYPRGGKTIRENLDQPKVVFGRASNCDVVLSLKGVSRIHFEIEFDGRCWQIHDLNSTNGTFVNQKVITRQPLKDGDRITLGPPGLVPLVLVFHQTASPVPDDQDPVSDSLWIDSESSSNSAFRPAAAGFRNVLRRLANPARRWSRGHRRG